MWMSTSTCVHLVLSSCRCASTSLCKSSRLYVHTQVYVIIATSRKEVGVKCAGPGAMSRGHPSWCQTDAIEWIEQPTASKEESTRICASLTIGTWNTLADALAEGPQYRSNSYDPSWSIRWQNIQRQLRRFNHAVDVWCLQEVDHARVDEYWTPAFSDLGYFVTYQRRNGERIDGCLIAWKTNLLKLVPPANVLSDKIGGIYISESHFTWYLDEIADQHNSKGKIVDTTFQRCRKHNIATGVCLQSTSSNWRVFIATTHFYWSPHAEDVRLRQADYMLEQLRPFAERMPCILCGDLNAQPNTATYRLLTLPMETGDFANLRTRISSLLDDETLAANEMDTDGKPHMKLRLLFDSNLRPICKWFRYLGKDSALCEPSASPSEIIEKATRERRLLITRSKRVVERQDCPLSIFLPGSMTHDPDEVFVAIVSRLRSLFWVSVLDVFSVCSLCNGHIEAISRTEIPSTASPPPPPKLLNSPHGTFFMCWNCSQLYWWSHKPNSSAQNAQTTLIRLLEVLQERRILPPCQLPTTAEISKRLDNVSVDIDEREEGTLHGGDVVGISTDEDPHVNAPATSAALDLDAADEWMSYAVAALSLENVTTAKSTNGTELKQPPQSSRLLGTIQTLRNPRPMRFRSSYAEIYGRVGTLETSYHSEPPFTNHVDSFVGTLDYILYSDVEKSQYALTPKRVLRLPSTRSELGDDGDALPNAYWPSDHIALVSQFSISTRAIPEGTNSVVN